MFTLNQVRTKLKNNIDLLCIKGYYFAETKQLFGSKVSERNPKLEGDTMNMLYAFLEIKGPDKETETVIVDMPEDTALLARNLLRVTDVDEKREITSVTIRRSPGDGSLGRFVSLADFTNYFSGIRWSKKNT